MPGYLKELTDPYAHKPELIPIIARTRRRLAKDLKNLRSKRNGNNSKNRADSPDFVSLKERFERMTVQIGKRTLASCSATRRFDDETCTVSTPARQTSKQAVFTDCFLAAWVNHQSNAAHFSAQCAKAKINEIRMFQTARSDDPMDMIQLRRIAMQIKPHVDWTLFGNMLRYWPHTKRDFIENYYLAQYAKQDSTDESK